MDMGGAKVRQLMVWEDEHIGCRVVYYGRNKNQRFGEVTEIMQVGNSQWLNLKLDGSSREQFKVPSDTVKLVPEELSGILDQA